MYDAVKQHPGLGEKPAVDTRTRKLNLQTGAHSFVTAPHGDSSPLVIDWLPIDAADHFQLALLHVLGRERM